MVVFCGQRSDKNSVFKFFLVSALKIIEPDSVLISSGFYSNNFWECDNKITERLAKCRNVYIAGANGKYTNHIDTVGKNLKAALKSSTAVTACTLTPTADWHKNEIFLIKNGETKALITGSSSCTRKDLGVDGANSFNLNTDMLICDDSYADAVNGYFFGDAENQNRPGIRDDYPDIDIPILPIIRVDNLLDEMANNTKAQINVHGSKNAF